MSTFSLGGKTKILFSKLGLLLFIVVLLLAIFGACAQKITGDENKATTAKASSTGLTSLEAEALAWSQAKNIFKDSVLFRLAPVETASSTVMKLSSDWQTSDRSDAWFAWYADSASGDWYMVSIVGKSVASKDIGTRSFTAEVFDSNLPREKTAVSMKDAAAAAKAQGANMNAVTWVEYSCDDFNSGTARKPLWVFPCSETLKSGSSLNYKIYVNAATGKVEGAKNERNEDMKLPIDIDALGQTKTVTHEADLKTFFSLISNGDPTGAVRQLAYAASPDEASAQTWLANFQSLKSLKVVSIEQASLEQWTDEWECYKVDLNITTSEKPEKYGWENGNNTRWITLIPEGAGNWKITGFATGP